MAHTPYSHQGHKGAEKVPLEKLKWYVSRGFDRHQIAKAFGCHPAYVANKCRKFGLVLSDLRRQGKKMAALIPPPPANDTPESPITPALLRLAACGDSIALRALARKRGGV